MIAQKEGSAQYRILPDGRGVPTTKGLERTEAEKRNISESLKGKSKPIELVRARSTIWERVRPLALRGAVPFEIADLTGFSQSQVWNALERKNRVEPTPDYWTQEMKTLRRRRAQRRGRLTIHGVAPDEKEKSENTFARTMISRGFITEDLRLWYALIDIFKKMGRDLPLSAAYRIMLETFLMARESANKGDKSLLEEYFRLGEELNPFWFKSEELSTDRRMINVALEVSKRSADPSNSWDHERFERARSFFHRAGVEWGD